MNGEDYRGERLMVRVAPKNIDLLNKFLEAYGHLALVTTQDNKTGRLCLWVTPDERPVLLKVLKYLPLAIELDVE